jgi:hypothetical protein
MSHPKTEIRQHPAGGFTLAVPATEAGTTRVYAGHFETEGDAAYALEPVRRPRWRQIALRLFQQAKRPARPARTSHE